MKLRLCAFLVFAISACDRNSPRSESSIELAPQGKRSGTPDTASQVAVAIGIGRKDQCLPLSPVHLTLRGRVRREVHLGPPGYGENPKTDDRDTIYVLALSDSVRVCGDVEVSRDIKPIAVTTVQLLSPPHAIVSTVGMDVSVCGRLGRAVLGWHFLPVHIRVDSIPEVAKPRKHRANGSSNTALLLPGQSSEAAGSLRAPAAFSMTPRSRTRFR